jgi:PadR family transcriptional regulator, regulatory protein PadR
MPPRPDTHPRTEAVFRTMAGEPARWWHGYDLLRRTGVKSGTLYPMLRRLAERGHLETRWEDAPPAGRPARHLYRLTDAGVAHAAELAGRRQP